MHIYVNVTNASLVILFEVKKFISYKLLIVNGWAVGKTSIPVIMSN